MRGTSHSAIGTATAIATLASLGTANVLLGIPLNSIAFVGSAGAGAIKADLDHHANKKAGKVFRFTWNMMTKIPVLGKIFGHRGITHTYYIPILIYLIALRINGEGVGSVITFTASTLLGWAVGYTSHLVADSLNPTGIMAFWPVPIKLSLMRIKTGQTQEYVFCTLLVLLLLAHTVLITQGGTLTW